MRYSLGSHLIHAKQIVMIRSVFASLMLGASFFVLAPSAAYAQTTEQTDKSEEDWRKSQKKRDASDILDDILNSRSIGQGSNQYPQNPMDALPDESRRHLMKERAKVIAESEPGQPINAPYSPSEAAKSDPELAEQEKEAWNEIVTDMKGGDSQGQSDSANGQTGTGNGGSVVSGSSNGTGSSDGQNGQDTGQTPSAMRGGSSASVADIMAQIKGMKSGGGSGSGEKPGQTQSGGSANSASQQGSPHQGSAPADAQAKAMQAAYEAAEARARANEAAQAAKDAANAAEQQSTASSQQEADDAAKAAASAASAAQAAAQAAEAARAQAQAAEQNRQASRPATQIGPLEHIKRERENTSSGSQVSAADFLKQTENVIE